MTESERDKHPSDLVTQTPPDGYEHHGLDHEAPGHPDRPARRAAAAAAAEPPGPPEDPPEPRRNVRIRKLRVLGILFFLGTLAFVSTVFGMMMAVTSDLPELKKPRDAQLRRCSTATAGRSACSPATSSASSSSSNEIAPAMKQAIVAIEDRRFWTNEGIDLRGIGRALWQDIRAQEAVQGGSTITMQLVKFAMAAENERTALQQAARGRARLRDHAQVDQGGDPPDLPQHDLLRQRRLRHRVGGPHLLRQRATPAAARTASRAARRCWRPHEAALIAGIVASPSLYDPLRNKVEAKQRRDLVLQRMLEQGYITREEYDDGVLESLPT